MKPKAPKAKKTFAMNDDNLQEDALNAILSVFNEEPAGEPTPEAPPPPQEETSLSGQVDQVVQGLSGGKTGAQVYLIDVRQLEPYPDQPFKLYPHQRLQELAEDIGRVGILSPILARKQGKRLQILAGHNRWAAAKLAGLTEVPVLLLEVDDDTAILVVTSTNLRQREKLAPSEKAFAYKMQMDALKRQGQRLPEGYNAAAFITDQTGDSRIQIHRYVRLTELDPGLLDLLDRERISMTPAVAISYLTAENQAYVLGLLREFGVSLTIDRAGALKTLALQKDGVGLNKAEMDRILLDTQARRPRQVQYGQFRPYLPPHVTDSEAEQWIIRALKAYKGE